MPPSLNEAQIIPSGSHVLNLSSHPQKEGERPRHEGRVETFSPRRFKPNRCDVLGGRHKKIIKNIENLLLLDDDESNTLDLAYIADASCRKTRSEPGHSTR